MKKKTKVILIVSWVVLFLVVFIVSALLRVSYLGSAPMKLIAVKWDDTVGKTYSNLEYENNCSHKYDLYIPNGLDVNKNQSLILYIHGGSFNSGSKEDGAAWCKYYATKGYIAATLDYSLQTKQKDASLLIMDKEIDNCVNAIYGKCKSLGYEVTGMATCGVSAGGTLAMNYAFIEKDFKIPVRFVFQLAAPADFEPSDWDILKKTNKWKTDAEFATNMTGTEITTEMINSGEYTQYINKISPARLVSDKTPPVLCGYGLRDHLVPSHLKFKLTEAFDKYGIQYDYIAFPKSNHGMYSDLDIMQKFIDKSLEYCVRYFIEK